MIRLERSTTRFLPLYAKGRRYFGVVQGVGELEIDAPDALVSDLARWSVERRAYGRLSAGAENSIRVDPSLTWVKSKAATASSHPGTGPRAVDRPSNCNRAALRLPSMSVSSRSRSTAAETVVPRACCSGISGPPIAGQATGPLGLGDLDQATGRLGEAEVYGD